MHVLKSRRMTRSFLLLGALLMSFFCTGIDIDQKNVGGLYQNIKDHSKEREEGIQKVVRNPSTKTQGSSVSGDEMIKEESNEDDPSNLSEYTGTIYEELCSGEILLSGDFLKQLKCRYVDRGIPFLKIAPFKEEEAYLDPRIVIYHDVIYEEEIETLKRLSKPKFEPATLPSNTTDGIEVTQDRIAEVAWLEDYEGNHVKLLSRRVEHITGLKVDSAEEMQIVYYGVGGHYRPHYDFAQSKYNIDAFNKQGIGNRIATVLFYMNDVAKGGGTVFTELNFTVWPKKGSAVFWYNLKRNGEGDLLTEHAACTVLSGTKWIATKWLHEVGQEFLRPCTLLENQ